ncbi:MAG: 3-deoxy-8-phosphooctulonate synthase [Acidobacteria bacterium]|uniref:3-deoxy-8-phosphooctulonate synthase n=1 Tax=Candidatus Polarisedimenticola svalbardensis TaxID=2886004 RepID=A0A8J6Y550_9BACT|nr:3-deoxy-8-phosphooctulonate synthase [Candidatus Polarisedimenticola svalbardensis]
MNVAEPIVLGDHKVGRGQPLYIIAGPCVLEDPDEMLETATALASICARLDVGYCFKASYRKDNRTSSDSYRGPGIDDGLRLLDRIKDAVGVPVVTDFHHPEEADAVAEVAEVLQIPAFLCRQTSLLEAAGRTGRVVNVKKGQFLAAEGMGQAAGKLRQVGCDRILFTERGSFFGYGDLTVDFRSIQIMRELGHPVVFDATHSVQSPGSTGTTTGGTPRLIPLLARCGMAAGCDLVFLEVHPEPSRAKSDAGSQLPLEAFEPLVTEMIKFRNLYLEAND